MSYRRWGWIGCLGLIAGAAWIGNAGQNQKPATPWIKIAPGVWRTASEPAGYALVEDGAALLIDAPEASQTWKDQGWKTVDAVLLTHYHRASCAAAGQFLKSDVPVRAPEKAGDWLKPDSVKKYWQESLPLRNSRTAYLVHPLGFDGIDYSLTEGKKIIWRGWNLEIVDAPGHARAHVAIVAQKEKGPRIVFCGGALTAPGKMWAPYTTDWDHWTDAGLAPTLKSVGRLLDLNPDILCPAHGPVISKDARAALAKTAAHVEDAGFLKSFERYSKNRVGNPPAYQFLAKEQAMTNGSKPWSRISEHLFVTGNSIVLTSKDNACLMFDPWDKRGADQYAKLTKDHNLGALEVVLFSHAHYDHYDGIYHLPDRDKFEVWALDLVALPIADPFLYRAPFLDARPVKFERRPRDGDTLAWREYRLRFHHFPGQSYFTMGVETVIDGKRCFFTADNFFHQDMFSGSGGWMGLNRSFPLFYAESAQKVLDAAPDWVLAEHGGPFEFNAEDFRRRVQWGQAAARALDALSPSGQHRHDWDPHHLRVEPLVQRAKPGATLDWTLVSDNALLRKRALHIRLEGRDLLTDQDFSIAVEPGKTVRRPFAIRLPETLQPGRHVFALRATEGTALDGADLFLAIDIEP